jgi:hypothetical protein
MLDPHILDVDPGVARRLEEPGQLAGVAEISVRPQAADRLIEALAAGGWPVRR